MQAGLRPLIEYSHGAIDAEGVTLPCANIREIKKMPSTVFYYRDRDDPSGRWGSLEDENYEKGSSSYQLA